MIFEDSNQYRKGKYGEELVEKFLKKKGYVVYSPDGSHAFDKVAMRKNEIFAVEVKTYPARVMYPDTGFSIKHYETYLQRNSKNKLRVFVFFVDEDRKEIYGNWLDVIDRPVFGCPGYPKKQGEQIYFHLSRMEFLCKLTEDQTKKIRKFSTRSSQYEFKKNE